MANQTAKVGFVVLALVAGCRGHGRGEPRGAADATDVVIPQPASRGVEDDRDGTRLPPRVESTPAAEGPASTPVGVPECDDFLATYQRCMLDKLPSEGRSSIVDAVQSMRESFRQIVNTIGPGEAARTCTSVAAAVEDQLRDLGCE